MRQAEMSRATAGDEWITAAEVPDPDPLPTVVGWKLLIRPVAIKTKTKGGILLPEQYVADVQYLTTVGRVLAMGPQAYKHSDFEAPWCKIGDTVCYGKFAGTKFLYKGVKLLLLEDRLVDMVVPDPAFIDPQFNISQG
jgi:co-chaperonin GroES (HSP10)